MLELVFLLVSVGVCFYFVGRITMMRDLLEISEKEKNLEPVQKAVNVRMLTIEKISGVYYAYIGANFAGQAENFDILIETIKNNKKFSQFDIDVQGLSADEQEKLIQAFHNKT